MLSAKACSGSAIVSGMSSFKTAEAHSPISNSNGTDLFPSSGVSGTSRSLRREKGDWTGYVNDWDHSFYVTATIDGRYAAICGMNSFHHNGKEDRKHQFRYCEMTDEPADSKPEVTKTIGWTPYDGIAKIDCRSDSVLTFIASHHNDNYEDRSWFFACSKFKGLKTESYYWTENQIISKRSPPDQSTANIICQITMFLLSFIF